MRSRYDLTSGMIPLCLASIRQPIEPIMFNPKCLPIALASNSSNKTSCAFVSIARTIVSVSVDQRCRVAYNHTAFSLLSTVVMSSSY